jgi:hypothetical protein
MSIGSKDLVVELGRLIPEARATINSTCEQAQAVGLKKHGKVEHARRMGVGMGEEMSISVRQYNGTLHNGTRLAHSENGTSRKASLNGRRSKYNGNVTGDGATEMFDFHTLPPGTVRLESTMRRRLYVTFNKETPRSICKKFNISWKQIAVRNTELHPQLTSLSKFKNGTTLFLPMTQELDDGDVSDEDEYCICGGLEHDLMLQCVGCNEWFHGACIGISEKHAASTSHLDFTCGACTYYRAHSRWPRNVEQILKQAANSNNPRFFKFTKSFLDDADKNGRIVNGTVRVFEHDFTLEDAIGYHACSLEANMYVINGIPLGSPLLLPLSPQIASKH